MSADAGRPGPTEPRRTEDPADAADLDLVARWLALHDPEPADGLDVLLLFGGSLPSAWDEAAARVLAGRVGALVLVGGAGHTTDALRRVLGVEDPTRTEASLMAEHLAREHGIVDVVLEDASTHCGNNITLARDLLDSLDLRPGTVGLTQEPTMQRRMDAVFRAEWSPRGVRPVNLPGPDARHAWPPGRWERLVLGEVPRLRDDEDGYGPRGRGFLAHVDVPDDVAAAHDRLLARHPDWARPQP
ncbi:ElyC/SanA/YdcF family protein [Nocardioides sp. GY 10127]|uniref:ElyC/SanA/YdcF family protein n=1 Tax=Nocardioides sp. GY 10127 TaxID=2569762 RepID=UPI0010A8E72A|nr:ElyC/SanA/YdcF family protein [Nocardioides sp. GY 10127]TIC80010.1 hypothetical protein E8D37_15350 [Nocardioides sp. GY 10127]